MSREIDFVNWFNDKTGMNLKKTEDKFCRWDFTDESFIVELKIRDKYYSTKLLQADKGLNLVMSAESLDKIPLYIVTDEKGVYVYNLNKINLLENSIHEVVAPVTTEFDKNKMITKYCYKLSEDKASRIIKY
jgi:hypothetical protein